jgi:hypothetical protein
MRSIRTGVQVLAILALAAGPALAQSDMQFAGTVGVGWTDFLLPAKAAHANEWLANGSAVLTLNNPGFNFQLNGNDNDDQIPSKTSRDFWSYGGDIFWRDYAGSFGINANSSVGSNVGALAVSAKPYDVQTYGIFGQWFAEPDLTMEIKTGRFQGQDEGMYGDWAVVIYPYHDLALSLTADYAEAQHVREEVRDGVFMLEYLPVHDVPVSLYVGYDYAIESQLPHQQVSVLLVGIKAYLGGGGGGGTLVDYQRNGPTNWDAASPTPFDLGF